MKKPRVVTMSNKIKNIDKIFKILKKELKNYDPPLISSGENHEIKKTPFTVLISCILSLRTKDEVTHKASIKLLKKFDTPEKILTLSEKEIQELIFPVGFYRVKAHRILSISKTLRDKYSGRVPDDFQELLKLKGVGRKTANIVMLYGHKKKDYLAIDTHCHRIPNRLGWVKTKTPAQTEKKLREILPKRYWYEFNPLFVKFGQNICLPLSPHCSKCPIERYCDKISVKNNR